jgi:hypothetical protein
MLVLASVGTRAYRYGRHELEPNMAISISVNTIEQKKRRLPVFVEVDVSAVASGMVTPSLRSDVGPVGTFNSTEMARWLTQKDWRPVSASDSSCKLSVGTLLP